MAKRPPRLFSHSQSDLTCCWLLFPHTTWVLISIELFKHGWSPWTWSEAEEKDIQNWRISYWRHGGGVWLSSLSYKLASSVFPLTRIAAVHQIQKSAGHHYKPIRRENRRVSTGCGRRRRTSSNTSNGICKSGTGGRIEPHHKQSHVIWLIFTTLFQELSAGNVRGGRMERKRSAWKVQQTDPSVPFLNYNSMPLFICILSSIILFTPGSVSHGGEGILTQ